MVVANRLVVKESEVNMARIKLTKFGKEVEKALIDKDMTKSELAASIGITPAYLNDILKGTREGSERRKSIVTYLNLNIESEDMAYERQGI